MKDSNEIAAEALSMALRATGQQSPVEGNDEYTDLLLERARRFAEFLEAKPTVKVKVGSEWQQALKLASGIFEAPKPKPEEPTGWGAVVEDATGAYWTLYAPEAGTWINYREGRRHYAKIAAVRVLSEGVTP